MVMQIYRDTIEVLKYDFDQAISDFQAALAAYAQTEDEAPPTADVLVERVVYEHDGQYEIIDAPEPTPPLVGNLDAINRSTSVAKPVS